MALNKQEYKHEVRINPDGYVTKLKNQYIQLRGASKNIVFPITQHHISNENTIIQQEG